MIVRYFHIPVHCPFFRCPAAFHTGDLCTPAGSVEVSLSHIVCPRHYDKTLNETNHFKTQHPNWCFHCYSTVAEKVSVPECKRRTLFVKPVQLRITKPVCNLRSELGPAISLLVYLVGKCHILACRNN
ncbi:putative set domain protein [Fasciolopsis buskii]|uniref:Putative set domain protein n=1 Tax=Fasciolopsis buskii TaxID=27845 RepID=A0A8E0VIQ0_9TREM|nr:putative set domain protein [Fasciolopsis buski]